MACVSPAFHRVVKKRKAQEMNSLRERANVELYGAGRKSSHDDDEDDESGEEDDGRHFQIHSL
jgi:hypothetical protein